MLPARLAWLARAVAIIFIRESAAAPGIAPSTATITTAVTTVTAASTAWTAPGRALGPGFVDFQITPTYGLAVQFGDGFGGFRVIRHLHKREPASSSCLSVRSDVHAR